MSNDVASPISGFSPPRLPPAVVRRTVSAQLVPPTRITLICAPAGYGKTVMAGLYGTALPAGVCRWITCAEDTDDSVQLLLTLAAALCGVNDDYRAAIEGLARDRRDVAAALHQLNAVLAERTTPHTVVLDDLQLISRPESLQLLAQVIDQAPAAVMWILLSRTRPELPLARWRLRGDLRELGERELRVDRDEVRQLLARYGHQIDDTVADALVERSQGWFAGLQLALFAAQREGVADAERVLDHLSGRESYVAEYVINEVLAHLPAELRQFLLSCAIVPQLHVGLCAAVSGRDDADQLLQVIVQNNLFVQRLSQSDAYRMHSLFADVLVRELRRRTATAEINQLYRRAAAWYQRAGDGYHALRMLRDGGLQDEAVVLLRDLARQCLMTAQFTELLRLSALFPEELLLADDSLLVTRAWALFALRDDAAFERTMQGLERRSGQNLLPHEADEFEALRALVRYLLADHSTLCADGVQLLERLQPDSDHARGWICLVTALTHRPLVTGRKHPQHYLELAGESFKRCGAVYAEMYLTGLSAAIWRNTGHPDAGLTYCRNALAHLERYLSVYTAVEAHYTLRTLAAEIYYWRDDIDHCLQEVLALAEILKLVPAHIGVQGRLEALLRLEACALIRPLPAPAAALLDELRADAETLWAEMYRSGARTSIAGCIMLQLDQLQRSGRRDVVEQHSARFGLQLAQLDDQSPDVLWLVLLTMRVALRDHLEELTEVFDHQLKRTADIGSALLNTRLMLLASLQAHDIGQHRRARTLFRRALQQVQQAGYQRMILDLPELLPLVKAVGTRYSDYLSQRMTADSWQDNRFTAQERRLIGLLLNGHNVRQISTELALAPSTVKWHLSNIYTKLGAHSRDDALQRLRGYR